VGVNPTRQTLQPEATGAATEVTNWLKPLDSVSRTRVFPRRSGGDAVTRPSPEGGSRRRRPGAGAVQEPAAPMALRHRVRNR